MKNALTLHTAYEDLLLRHRQTIWKACWRFCKGDRDRCHDLVQEVTMVLWTRLGSLRRGASYFEERHWVYLVARSVLHSLHRAAPDEPLRLQRAFAEELAEEDCHCRELLVDLVAHLSDADRELLQRELDGYSRSEIAAQLGLAPSTITRRMDAIIEKLKEISKTLDY